MLKQLSALLLFSSFVFPQSGDSLLIENNQSKFDTTFVETTDTLITSDSTKIEQNTAKADSLIPIQGQPLADVSAIISRNTFLFENYRYTGDLLRSFNLNFIKDLGFIGYPNESFIYGVGNGAVSYMLDGVLWNNRYTNSLDLNLVQSEDIDSIEIVPSPRGFLYGSYNNPVTVNFITRDFITQAPYARIKYYQGPNAEAMIDGRFSALLAKRWNLSFEVTNRSIDSTYTNTEFSFWQINAKLKYFLSNSVNITGWYYFVSTKQGLNGGVNVDSVANIPPSFNIDMYSPEAPVVYPSQKLDVLQNNFGLRTLAKTSDASQLVFSIYYRYDTNELRDKVNNQSFSIIQESTNYGATLNYSYTFDFLTLQLLGDYEEINTELTWDYSNGNFTNSNIYERSGFGAILTGRFLKDIIQPSIFFRQNYWSEYSSNTTAIGADVIFQLKDELNLYLGYSLRERFNYEDNIPNYEMGARYNNSQLMLDFKCFSNKYYYETSLEQGWGTIQQDVEGLGLTFNYKFWMLLIETNTSYYFEVEEKKLKNLPDWQFIGGLYVTGLFFNDNLNLKTGLRFSYTGKIVSVKDYYYSGTVVEPTNKLDFTLAGEIKKVAIVYFIWENVFGNEYYITPYYPMPERNIRFGLAWELFN